jgi:hypothetical protein
MNRGEAYPAGMHLSKDSVNENDAVEEEMKAKQTFWRVKELRK